MRVSITGLWFDVEKKTITTFSSLTPHPFQLWFDVEKKTITTSVGKVLTATGCGLM